jgi:hypothetical protein
LRLFPFPMFVRNQPRWIHLAERTGTMYLFNANKYPPSIEDLQILSICLFDYSNSPLTYLCSQCIRNFPESNLLDFPPGRPTPSLCPGTASNTTSKHSSSSTQRTLRNHRSSTISSRIRSRLPSALNPDQTYLGTSVLHTRAQPLIVSAIPDELPTLSWKDRPIMCQT